MSQNLIIYKRVSYASGDGKLFSSQGEATAHALKNSVLSYVRDVILNDADDVDSDEVMQSFEHHYEALRGLFQHTTFEVKE